MCSPRRSKLKGVFPAVLDPEALRGASGCWPGKASLSTAKACAFWSRRSPLWGSPSVGGCSLHLTGRPWLRDAPSHSTIALGGSGRLTASTRNSPSTALSSLTSHFLGFPAGVHSASSPGFPEWLWWLACESPGSGFWGQKAVSAIRKGCCLVPPHVCTHVPECLHTLGWELTG